MNRRLHQVRPLGSDRMGFRNMADIIPEGEYGDTRVKHLVITKRDAEFSRMRQAATCGREQAVNEGKIAQLFVGSSLMMSDTPHERDSNWDLLREARGDVLIAGLGLGVVILPLLNNERVTSITVIEKSAGVVKLVQPPLSKELGDKASRLQVIEADIFEWTPPRGARYDTIYFDIWPDICRDNLKDMRKLHAKFRRRKAGRYSWMSSWLYEELKAGWYG